MTATIQTLETPDGAFTLVETDGYVVASGWTADAGVVLARIPVASRPLDVERGTTGAAEAVVAYYAGDLKAIDDVPVRQHGGPFRTSVQPYATGFYRIEGRNEAPRLADEAIAHRDAGFQAMKVKLGFGVSDDIRVMSEINKALSDPEIELMVDSNHAYGRSEALKLGRALEDYNLRWYEEPVVPEDIAGYQELRQKLNIPIAGGENEHTPYGFHQLFSADAVDIAQPDIGSCGGITAVRDIAAMAQASGIAVNPHVWGSAVAQAASLQVIAALPVPHHSLFAKEPVLEYDRSSHPFRQQLISEPWEMKQEMISIPGGPGLGIEVRMDIVKQYQIN